tara:strand:- start:1047 stop:1268 length:222 start_codon:yes stop_codon:yes gene_type:complete
MKKKEKLEVIKMTEDIATDLHVVGGLMQDNAQVYNELMSKCMMIEQFGQILKKRWNIGKDSGYTSTLELPSTR